MITDKVGLISTKKNKKNYPPVCLPWDPWNHFFIFFRHLLPLPSQGSLWHQWPCLWKSLSLVWHSFRLHGLVCRILQARILEWAAIPFSRGSSSPKDRTQVSWIAGRFFTVWATGEGQFFACLWDLIFLLQCIVVSLRPYSIAVSTVLRCLLSLSLTL